MVNISAQTDEMEPLQVVTQPVKSHYTGTSVEAGAMFSSAFGPAFFVTPKISFQLTPRFFLHTGIGMMQYSLTPSKYGDIFSPNRNATNVYLFAEGEYLLNEKVSIYGSVMKDVSTGPLRQVSPYVVPNEYLHFGVDYKLTPNITIGAQVRYSNGGHNGFYSPYAHSPFY